MIEVIKPGKTRFVATCAQCGCEFSYELEDLSTAGGVNCPCCGELIFHIKRPGSIQYPYDGIPCSNTSAKISSNKTCEDCDFYKKYLADGKTYVGDSPCQWCQHSPYGNERVKFVSLITNKSR